MVYSVDAIMLTGNSQLRAAFAQIAIFSFMRQSYQHKRLIVVNHGNYSVLTEDNKAHIKEVRVPHQTKVSDMRNVGLEESTADFVIQWDDDDYHHEDRISTQLQPLLDNHLLQATFLYAQVRYNLKDDVAFVGGCKKDGIVGTILHRRTQLRYPVHYHRTDEDRIFAHTFSEETKHTVLNKAMPHLYIRTFNGTNVCSKSHIMRKYADKTHIWKLSDASENYLKSILPHYQHIIEQLQCE